MSLFASACTDLDSATNLNPAGPPMIRQVRMKEVAIDASGNTITRRIFAFGTHSLAATSDYPALGPNAMTTAGVSNQKFRIIMDEILVGNYLEEIACRAPIDNDAYDRVALGTTPDQIAKCAVAKDVLPASCDPKDEHSVCICKITGGCGDVAEGQPVGVLDVNQDGAADDTRFIDGAVGVRCGSIDVPMDVNNSYWNPSGDQNRPAMGGFEALGPAIVLSPTGSASLPPGNGMPTNLDCTLSFSPDIVDKQGNRVCAPPGGGDSDGDGQIDETCTEGDVSAFKFKTEPLRVANQSFTNGATGVSRAGPVIIVPSAPVAPGSLSAITVTQNGVPFTGFTVTLPLPNSIRIDWNPPPLAANTPYVISVGTGLTDSFGQPLVMPVTFSFTTGP